MITTTVKIFLVVIGMDAGTGWDKREQPSWEVCLERKVVLEDYLYNILEEKRIESNVCKGSNQ